VTWVICALAVKAATVSMAATSERVRVMALL
jgi:hypothetical protein